LILPAALPAAAETLAYEADDAAVGCRTANGLFRLRKLLKSGLGNILRASGRPGDLYLDARSNADRVVLPSSPGGAEVGSSSSQAKCTAHVVVRGQIERSLAGFVAHVPIGPSLDE
jgi:hypothetical protein